MIVRLICTVMGHALDRQIYDLRLYDTGVLQWRSRLSCTRCGWNDIRFNGAPPLEREPEPEP